MFFLSKSNATKSKSLLDKLFDAVVAGDVRKARKTAQQIVEAGLPASNAVNKMTDAMNEVDKRYQKKEYFTVDVASASSAMREAFKILEPHLKVKPTTMAGKVIIGSLKGNIQGLGKDIVAATLRSAGFQVIDLGVDVSPENFVEAATMDKAQVIAISVSVDETVPFLKYVVDLLRQKGLSNKVKTVIGGRAVSEETCQRYGIDAYAKDAWDCVKKVKDLLNR